jgi:hypothetical protein
MLAYAPYRRTGTLGLGAGESVPVTAGWHTPKRELISEFTKDQKRPPAAGEVAILQRLAERSNAVLRRMTGGHGPSRTDEMDFNTAQGLINYYLVKGHGPDGGDPVSPRRGGPETESLITTAVHAVPDKSFWQNLVSDIEAIPVLGDATKIVAEAAAAPFKIAIAIGSGARLDHVALGALKDQLKVAKDVAPYATTVVSLVPGVGSGVAAAIGMGAALAEGRSIEAAAKAAIRDAIPGGPLVQAGFDAALKVASGENVGQAALETARSQLPATAQKAFDIGLAVATGEKIQTALANGLASIAPGQMQTILAAGEHALTTVPGLSDALKNVAPGAATQGFKLAAGLLSHAGINEKALTAARSALTADVRQGFDAALKTQEPHIAWLANVTNAPVAGAAPAIPTPQALEPPKHAAAPAPARAAPAPLEPPKRAAGRYAPYPKMGVGEPPPSTSADVHSPTRTATEVRSPTSTSTEVRSPTSTSTEAYTQGNFTVTVTGGAGAGETNVNIEAPPLNRQNSAHSKGAPKNAQENTNVNAPRPKGPTAQENTSVNAPTANGVSGPPPDCSSLGAPIANMSHVMHNAGLSAVNGSGGRSRMVHGPDGNDYLFSLEGGSLVARRCFSGGTLSQEWAGVVPPR